MVMAIWTTTRPSKCVTNGYLLQPISIFQFSLALSDSVGIGLKTLGSAVLHSLSFIDLDIFLTLLEQYHYT